MVAEHAQRLLESEARRNLATAISSLPGDKGLLVDDTLYDPNLSITRSLDLFTDANFLHEHGIRTVAPLIGHGGRIMQDILAQPAIVILIRGMNATAARAAVSSIHAIRQNTEKLATKPSSVDNSEAGSSENSEVTNFGLPTSNTVKFLVLTTPRRSKLVEGILQDTGLSDVPIAVLPLGFLPFDTDLVTLDWPEAHRQIVLEGDSSSILASAAALFSLATTLNLDFKTIRTAGAAATAVAEELLETHGELYPRHTRDSTTGSTTSSVQSSPLLSAKNAGFLAQDAFSKLNADLGNRIAEDEDDGFTSGETPTLAEVQERYSCRKPVTLIIIDRGVDMVSPLLTQWTYEGLLDEALGLHNNVMDLPVSSILSHDAIQMLTSGSNASGNVGTFRKRLRSDVDPIFGQLRDFSYWEATQKIRNIANSVQEYYKNRPSRDSAPISIVKDYVDRLADKKTEHRSVTAHAAIASEISARTFDSIEFKRRYGLEQEMMEGSTATGRRVYVTDAMSRGESLSHVLRLCCLWSVTSAGIDSEEFDFVRREILSIYGLRVMPLLANLERAGMLVRSRRDSNQNNLPWIRFPPFGLPSSGGSPGNRATGSGSSSGFMRSVGGSDTISTTGSNNAGSDDGRYSVSSNQSRNRASEYSWQFARAALRLMIDFDPGKAVDEGSNEAIAAPYQGYIPLSVRLIEAGLSEEGWDSLPAVIAHTPLLPPGHTTIEHRKDEKDRKQKFSDDTNAVIVFIGGIARAEASSIRRAMKALGVNALIATTSVVSADQFVLSFDDVIARL